MTIRYLALPTALVRALQAGGPDANGQVPERTLSDGGRTPCRHCLCDIPHGAGMLILGHRPFPAPQPYAETGPIFLCADPCERHPESADTPAMFLSRDAYLVRAYGETDRIRYGTGQIVPADRLAQTCADLLAEPETAYVHLRSASNNCYQARVERA